MQIPENSCFRSHNPPLSRNTGLFSSSLYGDSDENTDTRRFICPLTSEARYFLYLDALNASLTSVQTLKGYGL